MKKKELEETYWKKGSILIDEGKDEEALESLNRALECNTRSAEAHALKSSALFRLYRFPEALKSWEEALKFSSKSPSQPAMLGQVVSTTCTTHVSDAQSTGTITPSISNAKRQRVGEYNSSCVSSSSSGISR